MAPSKSLAQQPVWREAIRKAADPDRARHYVEAFGPGRPAEVLKAAPPELARVLTALFSGSIALSNALTAHPEWLEELTFDYFQHPRQAQGLVREVSRWLDQAVGAKEYASALERLRQFKQREMLRIAARDLGGLSDTPRLTQEISDVADVCLRGVLKVCRAQIGERLGFPYHTTPDGHWVATGFAVIGLGKLGGQELNYSSDVDLVFVYSDEGHAFPKAPSKTARVGDHALSNHHFFKRLAEAFVVELTRSTGQGMFYRVDLRLRPEGDAGPVVRSLASYENYYAQWGQTWERMMLGKARGVAGDVDLAHEFVEMVQPFRYPRSLGPGVLQEIAAVKDRIENEVVRSGELERNVKLGRGGIREVEFIAQTLQLLHAGRIPFLQGPQTLPTLAKLVDYHLLEKQEAEELRAAYCFLRDVEHRLQMENDLQTHSIPAERKAVERLAALMGCGHADKFERERERHTGNVRRIYERLVRSAPASTERSTLPGDFDDSAAAWKTLLAGHSFRDAEKAWRLWKEFTHGPGFGHVSSRTVELARVLMPKFLALCPREGDGSSRRKQEWVLSDPDRVLARLDSFIAGYGARALLFETWNSNPSLFELMIRLFDRSEFLAETAIRTPDLVDELVLSGRLVRRKSAAETLADLRHGLGDEDQRLWLRRYHQAELMRIGLREILGLADAEQNLLELSALADACLEYALDAVMRRHRIRRAPFAVIGLGKLGGQELNYGSDLDILFVAQEMRSTERSQRLALELMELISSPTELGVAFDTDARLRPDGEKGLLVNTLHAYEEYYRERAQLWELQALTRVRPVAGDAAAGQSFRKMAGELANFKMGNPGVAAYRPEWRKEIVRMRQRIERERTPAGKDDLAIKTGAGGLMDAEFVAQIFSLGQGWQEANTLRALQRGQEAQLMEPDDAAALIDNYRALRRVEGILRRWSYEGETVLPDDKEARYRVAVRCGWASEKELLEAVSGFRAAIRACYQKVVG